MIDAVRMDQLEPVKDGLVGGNANNIDDVRLLGSRCGDCREVSIGTNSVCLNCGGADVSSLELSPEGELWTYTIVRHKPPGNYLGPEPFSPFALGLVELPDGIRVMAPIDAEVDALKIGTKLRLQPWILSTGDGRAYRAFRFAPAES